MRKVLHFQRLRGSLRPGRWPTSLLAGVAALVRRHWIFTIAAGAGGVLRVIAMLGFQPAVLFRLDSYDYLRGAVHLAPNLINVSGYSFFLWLVRPFHSLALVTALQHLMGLGVACMAYALLRRYGLPAWGATLAAAAVLFDPAELMSEQLLMADTVAMTLMMTGITVLLIRRSPTLPACAGAGALIGVSAIVRPTPLPLVALVPAYLLIRKAGWRRAAGWLRGGAALAAGLTPVLAYMTWFAAVNGTFSLTRSDGLFLWSRTMSFANCAVIKPPADLRGLCARAQPGALAQQVPSLRPQPSYYLWEHGAWQWRHQAHGTATPGTAAFTPAKNGRAMRFAIRAIEAQPIAYLTVVARDSLKPFAGSRSLRFPDYQPRTASLSLANRRYAIGAILAYTGGTQGIRSDLGSEYGTRVRSPYAAIMNGYQRVIYLPGPALALIALAGLVGCLVRRRRTPEAALLWVSAVVLAVVPAAVHEYDYRYILPAVPLACITAALALRPLDGQAAGSHDDQPAHAAQARVQAGPLAAIWPWVAVQGAVTWSLWELRATVLPARYLNDSSVHEQMTRFATTRIEAGHNPLTSWFPFLGLGSPHLMHYQATPAIVTGLAGLVTGPDAAFRWSLYLLWCLWPVAIYCSARVLGLSKGAAAAAAVVAPLLNSAPGIGYEQRAYVWAGFGVWTQLWASWALPFAWALTWRAMTDKRFIAPAAGLVALTAAFHYETGYLAFGAIPVLALLVRRDPLARLARAAALLTVALLASAWIVVPLLTYSRWAGINQALAAGPSASGYGARTTLGWLVTGKVFDYGHGPVISLLVAAGLVTALARWRRAGPERALVALLCACLLLSFGRTTFGSLTAIIPGGTDVFFRRFLMGGQLAGIYLAGLGAAELGRRVARFLARPELAAPRWMPVAALAAIGAAYLHPAWQDLDSFDARNARLIQAQLSAQASQPLAQAMAAVTALITRHGPGRVYAGSPPDWKRYPAVGLVPMYAYIESLDIDEVGYTLRTASLMTQPEFHFDPANPGDYALFGIRYLIVPSRPPGNLATPQPPYGAVLLLSDSYLRLYELPGNSYVQVADTIGSIAANRADVGSQTARYLRSALPGQDRYLTVAYAGARPAPPTIRPGIRAAGPPGTVLTENADLAAGTTATVVHLRRRAVVVLSASYDPGWSATIDGHPAATEMIAPALVGVTVPPGTHSITFRYTGYRGYPELLALAAVALLAAALTRRRPARSSQPSPARPANPTAIAGRQRLPESRAALRPARMVRS